MQDSQRHMHTLQQELQNTQKQIEEQEKKNRSIEKDLLQTIGELRMTNDQLKRQLQQAQEQVEEKQHATEERERQVRELTEQLLAMKQLEPLPQKTDMPQKAIKDMKWHMESKAQEKMCRGSAASDSNVAYFNNYDSTIVHSYDSNTREWRRLPDTPYTHFTLVVVHHILTMVGGELRPGGATDSLLSLMGEGRGKKWLPNLPAMPTKRFRTAVVYSGCTLIVAGGRNSSNRLTTVEVLDTGTRQ